ncbi:MAG: hypothetical protein RMI91_08605 [Gemmatales bacterium]|nr:hypothetical protein [Gemmatales bacterium]MDW7994701.1 hypothetical protein [Gemmatales bacterium]
MNRGQWLAWLASTLVTIGIVGSLTGQQQEPVVSPVVRPATALQEAINLYRKGEYEEAAKFFDLAEQGRHQLTPQDQKRLEEFRARNAADLAGRQRTLQQLSAAQEAVKNNQWAEAEQLLKQLRSSKYLQPQEQQVVNQLYEQVTRRQGRRWSLWARNDSPPPRVDAESLLAQGREALKNHELDRAETLARQAKEAGYTAIFPWSDSPDKLLRDIQAARAKQLSSSGNTAPPDADKLLAQAREALRQGNLDLAEQLAQQSKQAGYSSWWPWSDTPDKVLREVQQARQAQRQATAEQLKLQQGRRLLAEAKQALQQGDLEQARNLLSQAEQLQISWPPYEPLTPEKIRQALAAAESQTNAVTSKPALPQIDAPLTPQGKDTTETITRQNARDKLRQARQLYQAGRLDEAEALARRIRVVPECRWGLFEDTPDKLLADIYKAREQAHQKQAEALLAQARQKLEQGQFDEAERLAYHARALRPRYSIWYMGEHPDRLLAEIKARRQQAQRPRIPDPRSLDQPTSPQPANLPTAKQQAQSLIAQARAALNAGQLVQALQLARQAQQFPVTWTADEDSPDKIEKAVQALLDQQRDRDNPQQAQQIRKQALLLLADAREHQRQGRILEALRQARHAQQLRAPYRPEDETPEQLLFELQRQAQAHIDTFRHAAQAWRQLGRLDEAEQCLRYVRELQLELRADTLATDQQLAELQRLRQGQAPVASETTDAGRRLIEQARQQLRAGELLRAQQLARQVYEQHYHLRLEASQLLAEIDEAQYRQSIREANRFYELGVRAYSRGEYAQAAAYFQSINPQLLDERKRTHMQEILASKEMQAHALVQAGQLPPTPRTTPTPSDSSEANKPNLSQQSQTHSLLDQVQQQREVELQRLRRIKLEAERQANRFAQNNDLNKAIETLRQAAQELRQSELQTEAVQAMIRQIEQRLRTFEASREQLTYERIRQDSLRGSSLRQREILADLNRKDQVAQLMQQYAQYLKEAKYKEAEIVALKAKELDPDNPAAEAALFRARTLRALSDEERIKLQKERGFELAMQAVNEASAAPESDLQYPKDWSERTRRRNKPIEPLRPETPEDRDLYQRLQQPVSLDFRDKPLAEVLDHLRSMYGINIVADEPALQAAGISLNQPITIRLDNRPLRTCLNLILHNARLAWVIRDGVYIVTTEEGKRGKLVQKVYPVADLILPVQDFGNLGGNQASILSVLAQNMNQPQQPPLTAPWTIPGGTPVGQASLANNSSQPQVRVEPPKTSLEQTLIRLIHETIEPKSWDVNGGPGHIDYYPLGMQLVVSADPEIQEQVDQLLRRLRELQELQVTVEVRFITLSEAFFERIGVDFQFQVDDDETRFDRAVVAQSFAPAGMINEPDHLDKVVVGLAPGGAFSPDLDIPFRTSSFARGIPPFGNFPNAVGNNGGLDFGFAYLSDIEVYLFMEAAQGDTRTNVMQAPKITLFSGQTALLAVQDFQFLVTGATPIVGPFGQVSMVPTVTPFSSGLQLFLQAVVHSDRRYVRLSLAPTFTALSQNIPIFPIPIVIPVVNPDGSLSQVEITLFIQLPITSVLSVQTTVMVPDGGTVLMGGFKTLSEGRTEFGPPILSKLPYINRLFTNVGYGREARSLMIMITPRIIIPEEEEQFLGQQLLP